MTFECKHSVNKIVTRALVAELDFQPVGEEITEDHRLLQAIFTGLDPVIHHVCLLHGTTL